MELKIVEDDDPLNPRTDYDHLGTMVCWHSRYDLGDKQIEAGEYENAEEIIEAIDAAVILPLFLFDHSGLSMSTSSVSFQAFDSHGWDWGCVGLIYVTKETLMVEYSMSETDDLTEIKEKAKECLVAEINEYDQYLQGDVWGYVIEDGGEEIDSCWGFFGYEYAKQEGKSILNFHEKQKENRIESENAQAQLPLQLGV